MRRVDCVNLSLWIKKPRGNVMSLLEDDYQDHHLVHLEMRFDIAVNLSTGLSITGCSTIEVLTPTSSPEPIGLCMLVYIHGRLIQGDEACSPSRIRHINDMAEEHVAYVYVSLPLYVCR